MAETQCFLPVIEEEELMDEDFYENIEAPKFVDLTAPDTRPPNEDRHWFCARVGCDQKHEEELDSEAIYRKFVLRVMAARSPNVRLRKALNGREASGNLKCPLSAPPKSSKSRVSRMALMSSFPKKMTNNNNVKVRPRPLYNQVSATPNAKVKPSPSVAKALTTPRIQKKVSNVEPFRTVQSKKATSVVVPKTKVVARALVFNSPKKAVKSKSSSIELNTAMKTLCSAMKKFELNGVKKKKNGEGCNITRKKQLRGREVKSRVFDSLYSKCQQTNNVRCLKQKKENSSIQKKVTTMPHEETENDSSDMEIEERTRGGSLERCTESGTSQEPAEGESSVLVLSEASEKGEIPKATEKKRKDEENSLASDDKENEGELNKHSDKENASISDESSVLVLSVASEKGEIPQATERKRKDEDNSLASDDKENEGELNENIDKDNASASDENRMMSNDDPKKAILGSKHEDMRRTHIKKSTSTPTASQVVKYRKLKPTNPKPFKLRTDERGILREANLDKKVPSPLIDTTATGGGKAMRKHDISDQEDTDNHSSCKENNIMQGSIQCDYFNGKYKSSATRPHRIPDPKLKKPSDMRNRIEHKVLRPRATTPCKFNDIFEEPKEAAKVAAAGGSTSRPCSRGRRRALTVPKEPKFQSLHVPKSCCTTRK